MNNVKYISIIITTYNREKNVLEILKKIQKQIGYKDGLEVIICDSFSKASLKIMSYKKMFHNLNISYFNLKINHQAYKRNYGASKANGKYLIFLDDDCMPSIKFLFHHLKILKLNRFKEIYCGQVLYKKYINNKHLIKYRESRLINFSKLLHNNIPVKNFISMNMSFNKKYLKNKKIFDDRFRYYGFEDFEFAYRFSKNFKFILNKGLIIHDDNRDFTNFLDKHYYLGKFGIKDIIRNNKEAAKNSIFYKIENNIFFQKFQKFHIVYYFLKIFKFLLIYYEKRNLFYFPIVYKLGIFISYYMGVVDRKKNDSIGNIQSWYK